MTRSLLLTFISLLFIQLGLFAQKQFENASFETWEDIPHGSIQEPVEWSSIRTADPDELAGIAPGVWNISDDAHTGNHSLYLENIAIFGFVATGTITNGKVLANLDPSLGNSHTEVDDSRWHTVLTARPDSLVGWYKAKPTAGDFPTAKALLHTDYASLPQDDSTTWIGVAYIELSGEEVSEWTRFSTPFDYFNDETPEFLLSILTAGDGLAALEGSEVWFDDVELIYNETSISEYASDKLVVNSYQGKLNVYVDDKRNVPSNLSITDISGRVVFSAELTTGTTNQFSPNLTEGIYIVSVKVDNRLLTSKVFIQ